MILAFCRLRMCHERTRASTKKGARRAGGGGRAPYHGDRAEAGRAVEGIRDGHGMVR